MAIHHEPEASVQFSMRWLAVLALLLIGFFGWAFYEPIRANYIQTLSWIYSHTREFQEILTESVKSLADNTSLGTTTTLVAGSFLYGIFHAAGPGHGKIILSTYLLSQPERIGKSVGLAAASSLVQGIVAILLVYGLFYVFGLVSRDMNMAVAWSERLAFALVIAIGLTLIWRGVKPMITTRNQQNHGHHDHQHDGHGHHGHVHDHSHDHDHHHAHHDHCDHGHSHNSKSEEVCPSCGHAHVPSADQVDSATDFKTTIGVVLSIGMRPCTGAVLVLVFARFLDVSWAGALAVMAMSAGTAITVSALAIAAVSARGLALRMLGSNGALGSMIGNAAAMGGGLLLIFFGAGLLLGSFEPQTRSMGL